MGSINSYSLYKAKMIDKETYEQSKKCELYCYISFMSVIALGLIFKTVETFFN
jgi:hypothetical protein